MKIKFFAVILALSLLLASCGTQDIPNDSSDPSDFSYVGTDFSDNSASEESIEDTSSVAETLAPVYPEREWCNIYSEKAFLYDTATDTMNVVKGCDTDVTYPASITKLMTALTALKHLSPDTVVTAGDELDMVAKDASIAYILKGHKLTVSMLIEAMMLPSGGDAAYVLAAAGGKAIAGKESIAADRAVDVFVSEMNKTASEYGMTGSCFKNPDGYEQEGHYTTMRDIAILALKALECDEITKYTRLGSDSVEYASGHTNKWNNSNQIVCEGSKYYRANAVGLKTGSTDQAGFCLLSAFQEEDGSYIITGTFACFDHEKRFDDTLAIYDDYKAYISE